MRFFRMSVALLFCAALVAPVANAADILWNSEIADEMGADAGFVDLLRGAGHTVTRINTPALLTDADVATLNAADLVILGRAGNSSEYQNENGAAWNARVTAPVISMSAYFNRDNRMRWTVDSNLVDSGPAKLKAADPSHPIWNGIALDGEGNMIDDYNVLIDRGTSTNTSLLVNGNLIGTNPTVMSGANLGVAIADWPAGTEVGGGQVLAGYRMIFNGGSREADGAGIATAGKLDLTPAGQQLFLNAVNYALVPEPSSAVLGLFGLLFLMTRRRR